LHGAIFADDLAAAYKHERIGHFAMDRALPIHTAWDLGHSDETAIWLWQDIGTQPTFVAYYENSGEQIDHYLRWLKDWSVEHGMTFGKHYLPHDGARQNIFIPGGTLGVMGNLGFRPAIVDRAPDKWEAVKIGRRKFSMCRWDADGCKEGIARLKRYRKDWDERRGVWRDQPYHGPESNGADAYLTFAQSNHIPTPRPSYEQRDGHKRRYYERSDNESWLTA
jgi:hypothetical protein